MRKPTTPSSARGLIEALSPTSVDIYRKEGNLVPVFFTFPSGSVVALNHCDKGMWPLVMREVVRRAFDVRGTLFIAEAYHKRVDPVLERDLASRLRSGVGHVPPVREMDGRDDAIVFCAEWRRDDGTVDRCCAHAIVDPKTRSVGEVEYAPEAATVEGRRLGFGLVEERKGGAR